MAALRKISAHCQLFWECGTRRELLKIKITDMTYNENIQRALNREALQHNKIDTNKILQVPMSRVTIVRSLESHIRQRWASRWKLT